MASAGPRASFFGKLGAAGNTAAGSTRLARPIRYTLGTDRSPVSSNPGPIYVDQQRPDHCAAVTRYQPDSHADRLSLRFRHGGNVAEKRYCRLADSVTIHGTNDRLLDGEHGVRKTP
jgi:hypothetical protein